jgi:GT2 family glycosyltransferase
LALSGRGAAIVPSLGEAPGIERGLDRLRGELERAGAALVWVQQGSRPAPTLDRPGERLLRLEGRSGFARAVNAGIAAAGEVDWLALVNDDLEVEPGWLATLAAALEADARLGAVQGVNLVAARPELADGCGIGWNRWHQAVQIGHGEPAPPADAPPFEVLGVSATGALYRRSALEACRTARGELFDERLGSWYEDVELAIRLRSAGWMSRCVPRARAAHLGSATGGRRPFRRSVRLVRNRWLVAASLLGRSLPRELPRLAARDLTDLAHALGAGELRRALGYPAGWLLAAGRLPGFAHAGAPRLGRESLERFRVGSGA